MAMFQALHHCREKKCPFFVILPDRKAMVSFVNNEDDYIFWPNLRLENTTKLCYGIRPHLFYGLDIPKS